MDTKTIPESYILLRDVPKIPFDLMYRKPQQVAEQLSEQTPVLIIQNDCVLTTGSTVLQAFDRLEVAEFSAKALIDTVTKIGALVPIGEEAIHDLKGAFGLE